MSKPNWVAIRNEYISGNISYRDLAKKHNVSFSTLKEAAIREKWFEKRKEQRHRIATKTEQKTAEKIATAEANRMARINAAADRLLEKIELATEQLDIYLLKGKRRYTQYIKDSKTGGTVPVDVEEEFIRESDPESGKNAVVRIDRAGLKQIASALKDLKDIQFVKDEDNPQESPNINITIAAATPDDVEVEED